MTMKMGKDMEYLVWYSYRAPGPVSCLSCPRGSLHSSQDGGNEVRWVRPISLRRHNACAHLHIAPSSRRVPTSNASLMQKSDIFIENHSWPSNSPTLSRPSQHDTLPLLRLLHLLAALKRRLLLVAVVLDLHCGVDGELEDLVDSSRFLGRALNVQSPHLARDGLALLRRYGSQALCAQQLDAGTLAAKIGLETHEHQRCVGAEMQDLGIPLGILSVMIPEDMACGTQTLSMTFSSELGQSMAKHTKRRSVSG
jgi:hypothetical protein